MEHIGMAIFKALPASGGKLVQENVKFFLLTRDLFDAILHFS